MPFTDLSGIWRPRKSGIEIAARLALGVYVRMTLVRVPLWTSAIDLLDHVLDKGVVLDAWIYAPVAGVDLVTIEARVVVASIETYLTHAAAIAECVPTRPRLSPPVQPPPVDVQLRHVAEQMTRGLFEPQMHQRRADDRVRDERHDLYAATISSRPRRPVGCFDSNSVEQLACWAVRNSR
jgi:hypothetical protein